MTTPSSDTDDSASSGGSSGVETTGLDEDPVYHAPGGVQLLFGTDTYAVVL